MVVDAEKIVIRYEFTESERFVSFDDEIRTYFLPKFKKAGMIITVPGAKEMAEFKDAVKPVWNQWVKEIGKDIGEKFIELSSADN